MLFGKKKGDRGMKNSAAESILSPQSLLDEKSITADPEFREGL